MARKRISYDEMWHIMNEHSRKTKEDWKQAISAVIVYKQENWDKKYPVKSRSYEVSSNNKCFQDNKIANSCFGSCLDGTDEGVRLDWYNWKVDYCYMV